MPLVENYDISYNLFSEEMLETNTNKAKIFIDKALKDVLHLMTINEINGDDPTFESLILDSYNNVKNLRIELESNQDMFCDRNELNNVIKDNLNLEKLLNDQNTASKSMESLILETTNLIRDWIMSMNNETSMDCDMPIDNLDLLSYVRLMTDKFEILTSISDQRVSEAAKFHEARENELKVINVDLQNQISILQANLTSANDFTNGNSSQNNVEYNSKISQLETDNENLKRDLALANSRLVELNDDIESDMESQSRLTQELNDHKSRETTDMQLLQNIFTLSGTNVPNNQSSTELLEILSCMIKQGELFHKYPKINEEISVAKTENVALQASLVQVNQQLELAKLEIANFEQILEKQNKENEKISDELIENLTNYNQLIDDSKLVAQELELVKNKASNYEITIAALEDKIKELNGNLCDISRTLQLELETGQSNLAVCIETNDMKIKTLKNELQTQLTKYEDLSNLNNEIKKELEQHKDSVKALESDLSSVKSEMEVIQTKFAEKSTELESAVEDYLNIFEELDQEKKSNSEKFKQLHQSIGEQQDCLKQQDSEISQLKQDLDELKRVKMGLEIKYMELESSLGDLNEKNTKLSEDNHDLIETIQRSANLEDSWKLKNSELQDILDKQSAELESSVQDYLKLSHEFEQMKTQSLEYEKQMEMFESVKNELFEQREQLRGDVERILSAKNDVEEKCGGLEKSLKDKNDQITKLSADNQELMGKLDEIDSYKFRVEIALKEKDKELTSLVNQIQDYRDKLSNIERTLEAKCTEFSSQQGLLENLLREKELLDVKITEMTDSVKNYQHQVECLSSEKRDLESKSSHQEEILQGKTQQIAELNDELSTMKENVAKLSHEIKSIQSQAESDLSNAEKKLTISVSDSDKLQKELDQSKLVIENQSDLQWLKKENIELKNKLSSVTDELNEFKFRVNKPQSNEIESLKNQLVETENELSSVKIDWKSLCNQVHKLTKESSWHEQRASDANQKYVHEKHKCSKIQSQLEDLQRKYLIETSKKNNNDRSEIEGDHANPSIIERTDSGVDKEVNSLKIQLSEKTLENSKLKAEMKQINSDKQVHDNAKVQEINTLKLQLEEKIMEISKLEAKIKENIDNELSKEQNQCENEPTAENESDQQIPLTSEKELEALKSELTSTKSENNRLKRKLDQAKDIVTAQSKEIGESKPKVQKYDKLHTHYNELKERYLEKRELAQNQEAEIKRLTKENCQLKSIPYVEKP